MTGCCAPNCSNRANKGFKVHQFPANKERRLQWLKNIRRDNWSPTKNSRLCDAHFEESQFELRRMDGKIKLKQNAVPTIFDYSNTKPKKKPRFIANKQNERVASTSSSSNTSVDTSLRDEQGNFILKPICRAKNCTSYKNSQPVALFPFPNREVRCQVWVQRTQNDELLGIPAHKLYLTARLCAEHFDDSQFMDESKRVLVLDALPTIFPGHFVSLPMIEDTNQSTADVSSSQEQCRPLIMEFVKNEPLWDSSSALATTKQMLNTETGLTYQELCSNTSLVKLPSSLWAVHKGVSNEFVAFVHTTIPEPLIIVDRAIVFQKTCRANVYFKGRRVLLGMGDVKTLQEIETLLDQLDDLQVPHSALSESSEST